MTIKSEPYYWVICDGCAVSSTEGGEYSAWNGKGTALDDALNSDWTVYGDLHFCFDCTPKDADGGPMESLPCTGADTCPAAEHIEGCFATNPDYAK